MAYFQYPQSALVERRLTKEIFHEKITSPSLKRSLIDDVQSIQWRYKLAQSTINLQVGDGFKEIQVFQIKLKEDSIDEELLRVIDSVVPYPIIFEIIMNTGIYITSAHKKLNVSGTGVVVDKIYFKSEVFPHDTKRQALPVAISLERLYEEVFKSIMPAEIKSEENAESVEVLISKSTEIGKIQKEIAKLQTSIRNEKQFNKRVELNRDLKDLEYALKGLQKL